MYVWLQCIFLKMRTKLLFKEGEVVEYIVLDLQVVASGKVYPSCWVLLMEKKNHDYGVISLSSNLTLCPSPPLYVSNLWSPLFFFLPSFLLEFVTMSRSNLVFARAKKNGCLYKFAANLYKDMRSLHYWQSLSTICCNRGITTLFHS